MTPDSPETAFAAYEAARHRLPLGRRQGNAQRVNSLADLVDQFDTYLLDAFGVLNIGETAIAGVPERIAAFQAAGKHILVLTNAASYPVDALAAKYQRLGYALGPENIVSSRMALLAGIADQPDLYWGVMAAPDLGFADLSGLTYSLLADDPAAYEEADAFLMLSSHGWSEGRQELLEAALQKRPRAVWVGNPDIVAPREDSFSIEPGHYAHRLADRCSVKPKFFGKPFDSIYDMAFARLGPETDMSRILMVGDSLHTDILGAQAAGIASALVADFGFFAGFPVENAIKAAGISPDFILNHP